MTRPKTWLFQRKWIVYPRFQVEWIFYFAVMVSVLFLIVYLSVYASFHEAAKFCVNLPQPGKAGCQMTMELQQEALRNSFLIGGIASLVFIIFGTAVLSNRVAGPLFRTIRYLEAIERGEPVKSLGFRKNDHYAELAAVINRVLEKRSAPGKQES
jgi:hypothetical protein